MIVAENVSYRYGSTGEGRPALDGINLSVDDGAFIAVLGPNGSGKSTLGRCLNGLIRPDRGRVVVDGLDTADVSAGWEIHRRVGMVFQNPDNQIVSTTVERELAFGLENLGLSSADIRGRVEWALDRFHLSQMRTHPPHRLSGGQKQRLAIAAVTAMRPRYLVCDEPTALLDPQGRAEILALIARLRRDFRMAVVYITQYPEEAVEADRLVVMAEGRVVDEGPPARIFCQTERLSRYRLKPPLAVRIADGLRARRLDIPPDVMRPDHLYAALRRWRPSDVRIPASPPGPAVLRKPAVEFQGVHYTYQPDTVLASTALRGIDFRVYEGERVALIGPNGSGKSTLVQHVNGLLSPTAGRVAVDGMDLSARSVDLKAIRQRIGVIFQFPETQLFEETVFDDVAFGPRNTGAPEQDIRDRVAWALRQMRLDVETYAARLPFSLSGGEQRRVAIAGILAMRPRMLALDEPTAGLDPQGVELIEAMLDAFHAAGGTVMLISHDMDLVGRMADRVVVLDQGRVVADGPPAAILTDTALLASRGLRRPALVELLAGIREMGYPVRTAIFDVEATVEEIASGLTADG